MHDDDAKSLSAIGFLTVIAHETHGLYGGYLVLNPTGRPLEFHCTAPVKANRAQEILYGPTLEPFLYGEQIGLTLVGKSKINPPLVLTDREPVLAMRELVSTPVVLVLPDESAAEKSAGAAAYRVDGPHGRLRLATFHAGRRRLAVPHAFGGEGERLSQLLATIDERLDLAEPFERIRDAIAEAHKKP